MHKKLMLSTFRILIVESSAASLLAHTSSLISPSMATCASLVADSKNQVGIGVFPSACLWLSSPLFQESPSFTPLILDSTRTILDGIGPCPMQDNDPTESFHCNALDVSFIIAPPKTPLVACSSNSPPLLLFLPHMQQAVTHNPI